MLDFARKESAWKLVKRNSSKGKERQAARTDTRKQERSGGKRGIHTYLASRWKAMVVHVHVGRIRLCNYQGDGTQ